MGIVFLARDVALDRLVAIKLLPPDLAHRGELRERFLREARTAAKLSHPNIVPIHAVEEHGDLVFFVMTYVEGQTLTERIAALGPFPVREGVRVLREVAWALVHAHGHGLVHRDIKADNVLVERGTGRVLVTDFGIALVGQPAEAGAEIVGTPEFMSPEQIRGDAVDPRTDLYSWGVLAFLALSGQYPLKAGSPPEIMAHHLGTEPPRLATVAPGVPASLADLVDRCLEKDREERIQSAADLADRLGAALGERHELPVPVRHFVEELKRRGERSPLLVYVLLTVWLGPLAIGMALTFPLAARIPFLLALAAAAVAIPIAAVAPRVRRVLGAGYALDDVVQGLQQDLEARQEELVFLYGERYRQHARRLRRIAYASFAGAVGGIVAIGSSLDPSLALVAGTGASVLVGAVTGLRADKRSDKKARRRLKFWKGRLGQWLFRLSGFKLKRQALPSTALTARPTELAVGAAVLSLYESLPGEAREALPDLPKVVRGLEDDAQRMRLLVEEYTEAMRSLDDLKSPGAEGVALARRRSQARQRIAPFRDEAQRRLQDAVAALETLRVDMLRLSAGTAELTSVTTRLGSAREVAADIQQLLDAQDEVRRLLAE
jgi:serine/threonine-protein kinase